MAVPKKIYWALKTIQGYCNKNVDCDHCSLRSFCLESMQKEVPCEWVLDTIFNKIDQDNN